MPALPQSGYNVSSTTRAPTLYVSNTTQTTAPKGVNKNANSPILYVRNTTQTTAPKGVNEVNSSRSQVQIVPTEQAAYYASQVYGVQGFTHFNSDELTNRGEYTSTSKRVTGTVLDQNGSPLQRKVYAINQRTHRMISVTTSSALGAFTLDLPLSNESAVTILAEANTSEARNAIVYYNVVPVTRVGAPGQAVTDPFFANVILLLHGDGSNGSTVITDSSSFARVCTAFGSAQLSNAQALYGGTSIYFDGIAGTYVSCVDIPDVNFSTGDYTVELRVRFASTSLGSNALMTFGTPGAPTFELYRRGGLNLWNGTSTLITGSTILSTDVWYHIAWTRFQGVHSLWVNGNLEGIAFSTAPVNPTGIMLGSYTGALDQLHGWIEEARITNVIARYTSSFVPLNGAFQNS